MADKNQNLILSGHKLTLEEQRAGGIASGKARREKKLMKKTLELLLDEKSKGGKTYRELATLGLIKGAINGNAQNYKTILETLGELKVADEEEKNNGVLEELVEALNNAKKN